MRCPKCGAFMDNGRDICFMCGTNIKTYNPAMQGGNGGYYGQQGGAFPGINDYDKIYNNVKNGDKDVFDFFADHRGLVSFMGFVLVLVVIGIAGLIYYRVKTKEVKLTPVIGNLYFRVDDNFFKKGDDGSYVSTGDKGSTCNIAYTNGANSVDNYVDSLFSDIKAKLEPERDSKMGVVDRLNIYTTQEGIITINDSTWYYMNVFYPKTENGTPTILKLRFLTTINNGYFYNVELRNYSTDAKCSAALDNFARSLKFLDTTVEQK